MVVARLQDLLDLTGQSLRVGGVGDEVCLGEGRQDIARPDMDGQQHRTATDEGFDHAETERFERRVLDEERRLAHRL